MCLLDGPSLSLGEQLPWPRKLAVLPPLHLLPDDRSDLQPDNHYEHLEPSRLPKEWVPHELHLDPRHRSLRCDDWLQWLELVPGHDWLQYH